MSPISQIIRSFLFIPIAIAFATSCAEDVKRTLTLSDPVTVVPSVGLPQEVVLKNANNNLDVASHDGRVFLAFRTAPTHFASRQAVLYVISSTDEKTWDFEAAFHLDTDLREPRLLAWDGRLWLYFAVLGKNPLSFEPQGMMVSEYQGHGSWTGPDWFYEEGFIPWRVKTIDGMPYMIAYVGGESIYSPDPEPLEVHWLTTADGVEWQAVIPGQPMVLEGGCSETDFVFLKDGSLLAACRNEMGDEMGYGSKICRADADDLGDWACVADPRKYDSLLLFGRGREVYLIGRRNVTATGHYDVGYESLPTLLRSLFNELLYWVSPKRCSLWKVDAATLTVDFVLDLPSCGDTCFPGLVEKGEGRYTVYNYTSPLDGPDDLSWVEGQMGPTSIYRVDLTLP